MTWHHLIVDDFWTPVWPNLAAGVVVTAFVWFKLQAIHKLHKEHFDWHKKRDQDA